LLCQLSRGKRGHRAAHQAQARVALALRQLRQRRHCRVQAAVRRAATLPQQAVYRKQCCGGAARGQRLQRGLQDVQRSGLLRGHLPRADGICQRPQHKVGAPQVVRSRQPGERRARLARLPAEHALAPPDVCSAGRAG
jgi:hypothetical protein